MTKINIILFALILCGGSIFAQVNTPQNVRVKKRSFQEPYVPTLLILWDVDETVSGHKFFMDGTEIPTSEDWDYYPHGGAGAAMYIGGYYNVAIPLDAYHNFQFCAVNDDGEVSDTVSRYLYFSETAYSRPEVEGFHFENNYTDGSTMFTWETPPNAGGPGQPDAIEYSVYLDGEFVDSTPELHYTFTGLTRGSNYVVGLTTLYNDGLSDTTFYRNYSKYEFYFDTLARPANLTVNEPEASIHWGQPSVDANNNIVGGTYVGLPVGMLWPAVWINPGQDYTTFGDNVHFVNTLWDLWKWYHDYINEDGEGVDFPPFNGIMNYSKVNVLNISEVTNAEGLTYADRAKVLDATTNGGIGGYVAHYNQQEEYYGIMRVDDVYDYVIKEPVEESVGKVDFTWWVNKSGEGDFSQAYNYYPESYNIYLDGEYVGNVIPEFDGYEYQFDYDFRFENLVVGQQYTAGVEAVYRVGNSVSEMVTIDFSPTVGINNPDAIGNSALTVSPNPVVDATNISFSLPESQQLTVEIFNIMGEKIVTLADGTMPAGEHQLKWDTENTAGLKVASGFYFCTIRSANHSQTVKLLVR